MIMIMNVPLHGIVISLYGRSCGRRGHAQFPYLFFLAVVGITILVKADPWLSGCTFTIDIAKFGSDKNQHSQTWKCRPCWLWFCKKVYAAGASRQPVGVIGQLQYSNSRLKTCRTPDSPYCCFGAAKEKTWLH